MCRLLVYIRVPVGPFPNNKNEFVWKCGIRVALLANIRRCDPDGFNKNIADTCQEKPTLGNDRR